MHGVRNRTGGDGEVRVDDVGPPPPGQQEGRDDAACHVRRHLAHGASVGSTAQASHAPHVHAVLALGERETAQVGGQDDDFMGPADERTGHQLSDAAATASDRRVLVVEDENLHCTGVASSDKTVGTPFTRAAARDASSEAPRRYSPITSTAISRFLGPSNSGVVHADGDASAEEGRSQVRMTVSALAVGIPRVIVPVAATLRHQPGRQRLQVLDDRALELVDEQGARRVKGID
jgi:hypothetical protein